MHILLHLVLFLSCQRVGEVHFLLTSLPGRRVVWDALGCTRTLNDCKVFSDDDDDDDDDWQLRNGPSLRYRSTNSSNPFHKN